MGVLYSYQVRHLPDYQVTLQIFSRGPSKYELVYQVTLQILDRVRNKCLAVYQVTLQLSSAGSAVIVVLRHNSIIILGT